MEQHHLAHPEHIRDNGGMLLTEDDEPLALVFNTKGFKGAHFATFPEKLIRPMILAGCPEGGTVLDPFVGSGTIALESWILNSRAHLKIR